jgi:hypothetical protein
LLGQWPALVNVGMNVGVQYKEGTDHNELVQLLLQSFRNRVGSVSDIALDFYCGSVRFESRSLHLLAPAFRVSLSGQRRTIDVPQPYKPARLVAEIASLFFFVLYSLCVLFV